ncbi:alpha/beta hydrolase family protein [Alkalicoccobacillus murimartini]|uniref:Pimeloyl-ACP methyl ester carboxylesterase n=1 Tax=Alkalicoccobacillus murimartini TaxID=171685 RepID=A0ABT9YD63_9BACI|nr:alpha/beta fold hydrolase [Alkalicoccobacillus murimartini]MDQ0205793.1 pimeloyl-ACP methyl ester carboxylesterase [Alkalicoccobacillus murimartini]
MTHSLLTLQTKEELLSGALQLPTKKASDRYPVVLFVHGFVGSKVGEHRLFVKASRFFAEQGYASFRFDFSGCGESSGDYRNLTLSKQLDELFAIIQYIKDQPYVDPDNITLVGHSLGGAVSALTAEKADIKSLILWSAVAEPYEDIVQITGKAAVNTAKKEGVYDYHGFEISHSFFQDLRKHHPLQAISTFQGDVLIIHASEDEDVPVKHAEAYAKSTTRPGIPHYIHHANHTFASTSWENLLFEKTNDWLKDRASSFIINSHSPA